MTRTELANKVKIILDEFSPGGVGLPFDEYIGPALDESAREIVLEGPLYLLTPSVIPLMSTGTPPESLVRYEDDKAYIPEPGDFARLYELKYPPWKKSVRETISRDNQQYKLQENQYLRSGYARPFVARITRSFEGTAPGRYLECGRVENPGSGTLVPPVALYVKNTRPEDLALEFTDALCYRAAGKVLISLGDLNKAKVALEQSTAHLAKLIN